MAGMVFCTFAATGLTAFVDAARQYNARTPALAANLCAFYVARQARVETDKRSVPIARIDAELAVEVTPRLGKRGQPLSMRSSKNRMYKSNLGPSKRPPIPFTWLLIGARANPYSEYKRRTGQRWALPQHPFKGKKRSDFADIMQKSVTRMVKARHSSSGFLQVGWLACVNEAEASGAIPTKYRRGRSVGAPTSAVKRRANPELGHFIPAVEGSPNVQCTIENRAGMAGGLGILDQKRNEALWRVGEPALNAAIAIQAAITFNYVAEQEARARFEPLRAYGVVVDI